MQETIGVLYGLIFGRIGRVLVLEIGFEETDRDVSITHFQVKK